MLLVFLRRNQSFLPVFIGPLTTIQPCLSMGLHRAIATVTHDARFSARREFYACGSSVKLQATVTECLLSRYSPLRAQFSHILNGAKGANVSERIADESIRRAQLEDAPARMER